MREYFNGFYFKCQSDTQTLAVIPAFHKSKDGKSCSVQLITDSGSWNATFPAEDFAALHNGVLVGSNRFGSDGFCLGIDTPSVIARGAVRFGRLSPIRYDIMGPFCLVPFLECRHSVFSMQHTVTGRITVNGENYVFQNARGYWEGDRGRSFPRTYIWTQCGFEGGSLMLSVADIPFCGIRFTGIIGVIQFDGREYRLATYLGAGLEKLKNGEIIVRQRDLQFTAGLIEKIAQPLFAPTGGVMSRTIRESASCRAFYALKKGGRTLFSFETDKASFEYEYPV